MWHSVYSMSFAVRYTQDAFLRFCFFFKQKTAYEIRLSLVGFGDVYKRQVSAARLVVKSVLILELVLYLDSGFRVAVSYTHLTLRRIERCRSRWSPYH